MKPTTITRNQKRMCGETEEASEECLPQSHPTDEQGSWGVPAAALIRRSRRLAQGGVTSLVPTGCPVDNPGFNDLRKSHRGIGVELAGGNEATGTKAREQGGCGQGTRNISED